MRTKSIHYSRFKVANATLPYAIGLEVYNTLVYKQGVYSLDGLEKNKTLPAKGKGSFKTMKDIRPANTQDKIEIPIYKFKHEGSRAIFNSIFKMNNYRSRFAKSITKRKWCRSYFKYYVSRRGKLSIYIPLLDENFDMVIESTIEKDIKIEELRHEIHQARSIAQNLAYDGHRDAEKPLLN